MKKAKDSNNQDVAVSRVKARQKRRRLENED